MPSCEVKASPEGRRRSDEILGRRQEDAPNATTGSGSRAPASDACPVHAPDRHVGGGANRARLGRASARIERERTMPIRLTRLPRPHASAPRLNLVARASTLRPRPCNRSGSHRRGRLCRGSGVRQPDRHGTDRTASAGRGRVIWLTADRRPRRRRLRAREAAPMPDSVRPDPPELLVVSSSFPSPVRAPDGQSIYVLEATRALARLVGRPLQVVALRIGDEAEFERGGVRGRAGDPEPAGAGRLRARRARMLYGSAPAYRQARGRGRASSRPRARRWSAGVTATRPRRPREPCARTVPSW